MDADTLDALDNLITDGSDQAMAWYSQVADKPVIVPSALIQAQQATAAGDRGAQVVSVQGGGQTLLPSGILSDATVLGVGPLVLVGIVAVVGLILYKVA